MLYLVIRQQQILLNFYTIIKENNFNFCVTSPKQCTENNVLLVEILNGCLNNFL